MRHIFTFTLCSILTWALFHFVFRTDLMWGIDRSAGVSFLTFWSLLGGFVGSVVSSISDDKLFHNIDRAFRALGDLISATAEFMRKSKP